MQRDDELLSSDETGTSRRYRKTKTRLKDKEWEWKVGGRMQNPPPLRPTALLLNYIESCNLTEWMGIMY